MAVACTCLAVVVASLLFATTRAESPANPYFNRTWERLDKPVSDLQVSRTWMWGPQAFTGELTEAYAEAPNGQRTVQYFDKSRMEISSDASVDVRSEWYVTNGLLVIELITGRVQTGDSSYHAFAPAAVNVAGDAHYTGGPTYASFGDLLTAQPLADGEIITQRIARSGSVSADPTMAKWGVITAHRVTEAGIDHQIAAPFWDFMNSEGLVFSNDAFVPDNLFLNPFYATGFPVTEAYWATVTLAGAPTDVLIQCFERRCLTFTPTNTPTWQIEAGNVGQHYHHWRYSQINGGNEPPRATLQPTATTQTTTPQNTATVTPGSIPTGTVIPTTAVPTATTAPEDPPLSFAYLNPESAARTALAETCNCDASAANPIIQSIISKAYTYRHQYHLATAEPGSFNRDTTGYFEWLTELLEVSTQPGWAAPSFHHLVVHAIYQPSSPIGIQIRRLEAGLDPLFSQFGAGPEVYWTYLIDPAIRMTVNPFGYEAHRGIFEDYVDDYQAEFFNDPAFDMTFGDYLASIGFAI